jgi:hypothetical protein
MARIASAARPSSALPEGVGLMSRASVGIVGDPLK